MPIKPLYDYFNSVEGDKELSLKEIQMKAVTLVALSFMIQPSDIAPRTELFVAL